MDMDVLEMEQFPLFEDLAMLDEGSSLSLEYEDNGGKYFPGYDSAPKLAIDQAGKEVLDDLLLLSQDDPLDLDWMESGSLEQFLEGMGANQFNTPATQEVVTISEPVIVIKDANVNHSVLHDLLTQPITIKQSPPVRVSQKAVVPKDLSQIDLLEESVQLAALQPVIASPSGDILEVPSEISFDSNSSLNTSVSQDDLLDAGSVEHIVGSLSAEEIDSLLSGSEPSSPDSISDQNDPDFSPEQSEDEEYTPKSSSSGGKQKGKKRRSGPYSTKPADRKDRKRDQNKNAAIRYRNKKREEAEHRAAEEQKLSKRNKDLHDKVDQLNREIKYMKDLISEVCKAKGLKVTFKTPSS